MAIIKLNQFFNNKVKEAIEKSRKNDTISFNYKIRLQEVINIKNNITFDGNNKGIIVLNPTKASMIVENVQRVTFKNLILILTEKSNLLNVRSNLNVEFQNVKVVIPRYLDSRDIYPIVTINSENDLNINLSLDNVDAEIWQSVTKSIHIKNSKIGNIYNDQSFIKTHNATIVNSEINNTQITQYYNDPTNIYIENSSTKGDFILKNAQVQINGINFGAIEDFDVRKYEDESMAKTEISNLILENCPDSQINGITYSDYTNNLQNAPSKMQYGALEIYNSTVEINRSNIPFLDLKSIASNSTIKFNETNGDLEWIFKNTDIKSRISETKKEKALDELDKLIGLENAKEQIKKMLSVVVMNKKRKDQGMQEIKGMSNHMVFAGSAGTGKTTVAKIYGRALYEEGILQTDKFIQATRKDLVGRYIGETALKTNALIQKARGGVLFIDEAYSLKSESQNDFAPEAVAELIACMEEYRDELVVILAGYTKDMENFIYNDNEGLPSRFNSWIYFDDYNEDDLNLMLRTQLQYQGFQYNEDTDQALSEYLHQLIQLLGDENGHVSGNGRFIRNFIQSIVTQQALRLAYNDNDSLTEINADDVFNGAKELFENSTKKY